jgi:7-carboxy-7-deazaguanine synthase
MLTIKETFISLDGEISPFYQGRISYFIRTSGCNLKCSYCDTKDSQKKSKSDRIIPTEKILKQFFTTHIVKSGVTKLTITGGEPLLQETGVNILSKLALDKGMWVTVETNGSIIPTNPITHPKFGYVYDYKLPSSGSEWAMKLNAVKCFSKNDVWKFVIGNLGDYKKAKSIVGTFGKSTHATIAFQPVHGVLHPKVILDWMVKDEFFLPVVSVQIHKIYGMK